MDIWSFIQKQLYEQNKVMLITVVERTGSSPGVIGFKMAVSENGDMYGSIGGGAMEYKMVELAKKEAKSAIKKAFVKKQIHNADAGKDKSGLLCSGEQSHAFTLINSSKIELIDKIANILNKGENGTLVLTQDELQFIENTNHENRITYTFESENIWKFSEQIGVKPSMYIFGAGHVSLPLSEIFRILDFQVIVFDDRKDLSTFNNNIYAHQKHIIDYKNIGDVIPEGENTYVVIMTVGHKSDEVILKQLTPKNLKYLGMIGSKSKVKTIYDSLLADGMSRENLEKVDSPIGLSINSKTTAEIAISIAAKVIQIKNG